MYFQNIKTQWVDNPCNIQDTRNRIYFPTQNFLRLKQILSIETFSVTDMALSPVSGNALPIAAQMGSGFVTLYGDNPEKADAKGDWMQQIPLWAMHRMNNGTDPFVFDLYQMVPRNIVWEKSYVEVTAPLNNNAEVSFCFLVSYSGNEGDN